MRNRPNERAPENLNAPARRGQRAAPERRCILTGESRPAEQLVRLAIAPDGSVLPDILGKAPGRGAWVTPDRDLIEKAGAKGLKAALARSFKSGDFAVPDDLAERIDTQLEKATLDRLGLEARSSHLLTGTEKIEGAARGGQVDLLLHAADSAPDGRSRLAQAWRVGRDLQGSGETGLVLPVGREALSRALGRQNAVHVAVLGKAAADRVMLHLGRWLNFTISPMEPQAAVE